jgi:hypothetical protein
LCALLRRLQDPGFSCPEQVVPALDFYPVESLLIGRQLGCAVIFALKWNAAKRKRNFVRFDAKKVLFRLFCIDAKHRNLKRNKNGTKQKQNEKETKNCHYFCFGAKWSEKLPSFSLWSEMEAKNCHHFCFKPKWKQNFFALMRKNEIKRKQNEKEAKTSSEKG